ncbi:MAG: acetylglutamate kinase [Actinomycetales bacterium]
MSESSAWINSIKSKWLSGERFVLVHGGGPQIDLALKNQNIHSEFKDGLRVTSHEAMQVVEQTLTGIVQRRIVNELRRFDLPAIGISGSDGETLMANIKNNGEYGLVGDITSVNTQLLATLIEAEYLPVISPIGTNSGGEVLNVNADIAAGAIAGALSVEEIIFMTDVPGIYLKWPDKESLIEKVSISDLESMSFAEGMIPKVEAVKNAIRSGAGSARIIDGKDQLALSMALEKSGGTWIQK